MRLSPILFFAFVLLLITQISLSFPATRDFSQKLLQLPLVNIPVGALGLEHRWHMFSPKPMEAPPVALEVLADDVTGRYKNFPVYSLFSSELPDFHIRRKAAVFLLQRSSSYALPFWTRYWEKDFRARTGSEAVSIRTRVSRASFFTDDMLVRDEPVVFHERL